MTDRMYVQIMLPSTIPVCVEFIDIEKYPITLTGTISTANTPRIILYI